MREPRQHFRLTGTYRDLAHKLGLDKSLKRMKRYRCTVCGYVYDPQLGDPDGGIKPGTPFEEIPDDWACPICGASKDEFEEED